MTISTIQVRMGALALVALLAALLVVTPSRANAASATTCSGLSAPAPCLDYHHGAIWWSPRVHPIFWGAWWNTKAGAAAQGYVDSLLLGLGKSQDNWTTILNQYGTAIQVNTPNLDPDLAKLHGIGIDGPLLEGSTVDTSNPPPQPTDQQIGMEATAAAAGRIGELPIPLVLTPPGVTPAHDITYSDCAHHFTTDVSVPSIQGTLPWAEVSYQEASGWGCNHGRGVLAGLSIAIGHELAETITDPYVDAPNHNGAWYDANGDEIGDKCQAAFDNVLQILVPKVLSPKNLFTLKLPTGNFTMQELWSNSARACVKHS